MLHNKRTTPWKWVGAVVFALMILTSAKSSFAEVLLFDDFDGPTLDTDIWGISQSYTLARTQMGNVPGFEQEGTTSFLALPLDTYNPDSPGTLFLGSEIYSLTEFAVEEGMEFEARVRALDVADGQVCAFYTFGWQYTSYPDWVSDEIDVELVTSDQPDRAWLSNFNNWGEEESEWNDGIHNIASISSINDYSFQDWNTYKIRWYADRIEWYVNGTLVNTHTSVIPDLPMSIRANFWVAGENWPIAYEAGLQPAANPSANVRYFYDVDYIKVTRLSLDNPLDECTSNADCDDGLFCNGAETCVSGSCQLGADPCSGLACDEEAGVCSGIDPLDAPTDLTAHLDGATVNLSWLDNSGQEDGFEVFRARQPKGNRQAEYSLIATTLPDRADFDDSPGKGTWLYKVRAIRGLDVSAESNSVQIVVKNKTAKSSTLMLLGLSQ